MLPAVLTALMLGVLIVQWSSTKSHQNLIPTSENVIMTLMSIILPEI